MPVSLEGLGHRFAGRPWLFTGVTRKLLPGQVYALTGPSGSGKSTLLGMLAGWIEPTAGRITRSGIRATKWVFQNPHGAPGRSASDLVAFPLLACGAQPDDADRAASDLLDRFNLSSVKTHEFRSLSGGEAQRLMLARAVASAPDLLLIDEPTAQLDATTAATVNSVIGELGGDGMIVVVATHDERTRDACSAVIDLALFAESPAG
ncbi:ATP-binding cassette domain-containing protein [Agromyces archimandritae]|uniref:ATP-binding cassette domain-containing protein n=1 Tax=Agromyces archimandritae TaxID=2781962 RepID=A0A975IP66_9MICO|nr:ATP-binding cassette domain-containing protein [Agromyces archimandritae]QTX05332.1 ATP-binding cassette domain-containing protein [Agromyces archimandritae]